MEGQSGGCHEWLIEFTKLPDDIEVFTHILDGELKALNSDYEAKRSGDLSLQMPIVQVASDGLFEAWLKKSNKLGGQHKIPRLNNNRDFIDELLAMNLATL